MQVFKLYGAIFLFGLVGFAAGLSLKLRGRVGIVLGILMTLIVLAIVGLGFEL